MQELYLKNGDARVSRKRMIAIASAAVFGAGVFVSGSQAKAAQSAADFYRGKVLTIIIPYGAAGGYEYWAAAIKPYFQKELGVERIDLVNKTGGGGLVGANTLYMSKPDGLTIGDVNGTGALIAQLINKPGVSFDVKKYGWIGAANIETTVTVAGASSPYKTFSDLAKLRGGKTKVTGLSDGYGGEDYVGTALPMATFGIPFRMLLAYQGSSFAKAGILRGDGDISSFGYSVWQPVLKSHSVVPLFVATTKPFAALPNVPTILSLGKKYKLSARKMALLTDFVHVVGMGKDFATPPGTPADRIAFMRAAFKKAAENPAFVAVAAKAGRVAGYTSPKELQDTVNDVFTNKAEFLPFLKK